MRIAISTAVYYPMINGVAVFSHNLATGLTARGHEVLVLCPSQTGLSHVEVADGVKVCYLKSSEIKVYPDQIHKVPAGKRVFYEHGFRVSAFPSREVSRILEEFSPEVVHIQVFDMIGLAVSRFARKRGAPVVTTEHNRPEVLTDPLKMPRFLKKPVKAGLSSYFVAQHSKSDFVTMPTRLAIRELFEGRKVKVPAEAVSNGVDLSAFEPGRAEAEIYRKYSIPKDAPVVLYVGRVDPEKNVGTVVSEFTKVLKSVPETILVVVGDGVDRVRLEGLAERLGISGSVRFLGRVLPPDLYELYKLGSVFTTASEIETQGIVLIEAAASGLPLVAVDGGAVAEVCRDGENGFLISKNGDMAEAIVKILADEKLRKKFAEKSIEIAHEHDFEKTLDKFIDIYNRVITKN